MQTKLSSSKLAELKKTKINEDTNHKEDTDHLGLGPFVSTTDQYISIGHFVDYYSRRWFSSYQVTNILQVNRTSYIYRLAY